MTAGPTSRKNVSRVFASLGIALALALLLMAHAGAQKNVGHLSISLRVQTQTQNCQDLGGTIDVTNSYGSWTNGHQLIKSVTSCSGGDLDGVTCTNTKDDTTCTKVSSVMVGGEIDSISVAGVSSVSVEPVATPFVSSVSSQTFTVQATAQVSVEP